MARTKNNLEGKYQVGRTKNMLHKKHKMVKKDKYSQEEDLICFVLFFMLFYFEQKVFSKNL